MQELKNTQAKRLYERIKLLHGEEKADAVLEKLPLSATPTPKRRREWVCAACAALNDSFDRSEVLAIRKGCLCKPSPAAVKPMKALWSECDGVAQFAARATETANGTFSVVAEDNALLLTYPRCYCPMLKGVEGTVPVEWCYCTVGYSEDFFARITGSPCSAELIDSVASGGTKCLIRIKSDAFVID